MKKKVMLKTFAKEALMQLLNKAQFSYSYEEENQKFNIEPESGWSVEIQLNAYPNIYRVTRFTFAVEFRYQTPGAVVEKLEDAFKDWVRVQTGPEEDYHTQEELIKIYHFQKENPDIIILESDQVGEDYPIPLNLAIVSWNDGIDSLGSWNENIPENYPSIMGIGLTGKVLVHIDEGTYSAVHEIKRNSLTFYSPLPGPEQIWKEEL